MHVGYWSELWDQFLLLDDEFFEAYLEFSSVPWNKGTLEPKVKEFIYIAIDVRQRLIYTIQVQDNPLKNALKYGATKEEIMEVFQLVSVLAISYFDSWCTNSIKKLEKSKVKS